MVEVGSLSLAAVSRHAGGAAALNRGCPRCCCGNSCGHATRHCVALQAHACMSVPPLPLTHQ